MRSEKKYKEMKIQMIEIVAQTKERVDKYKSKIREMDQLLLLKDAAFYTYIFRDFSKGP